MTPDRSPFTMRAAFRRQAVLTVALPLLGVVVLLGVLGHAPLAGMLLSGLLVVLAGVRLVLPTRAVGALAVRSRPLDVLVMLLLGIGIGLLAGSPNL